MSFTWLQWLLFSFRGRLSRKLFWLSYPLVLLYLASAPALILASIFGLEASGTWKEIWSFGAIISPAVWTGSAIGTKRLHDRGKSGWWMLIFGLGPFAFVGAAYMLADLFPSAPLSRTLTTPFLILGSGLFWWGVVELGFRKGTEGPNRFG